MNYDIDAFLGIAFSEARPPIDVVYDLWGMLESDEDQQLRPDTQLLPPEIHFRDLAHFHSAYMGNGFDGLLDAGNGRSMFRRALVAAKEVALDDVFAILTEADLVFRRHSISLPPSVQSEWWLDGIGVIPQETLDLVRKDTADLTAAYRALPVWPASGCVFSRLLDYMGRHRHELLNRHA